MKFQNSENRSEEKWQYTNCREREIHSDRCPTCFSLVARQQCWSTTGNGRFFCPFSSISPPILFKKNLLIEVPRLLGRKYALSVTFYHMNGFRTDPLLGSQRTLKMWGPFLRFLHIQEIFFQPNSFWEAEWVFCEGRRRSGFMCWVTDPHTEALPLSFFQLKVEEKNIRQDVSNWRLEKNTLDPDKCRLATWLV